MGQHTSLYQVLTHVVPHSTEEHYCINMTNWLGSTVPAWLLLVFRSPRVIVNDINEFQMGASLEVPISGFPYIKNCEFMKVGQEEITSLIFEL